MEVKLDTTAVNLSPGVFLCLLNFTMPVATAPDRMDAELRRIASFVERNFPAGRVHYQVNATFRLVHNRTGDVRLFTGSFFPNRLQDISLSGEKFLPFDSATFANAVLRYVDLDHANRVLSRGAADETSWTFSEVVSFVFCLQVRLSENHAFLRTHNLISANRGRGRRRRHVTLLNW